VTIMSAKRRPAKTIHPDPQTGPSTSPLINGSLAECGVEVGDRGSSAGPPEGAMSDTDILAAALARLTTRPRRCLVHENPDHGWHLLLIDDDGAGILAEVDDGDVAIWLCHLVNQALDRVCALLSEETAP